MIDVYYMLQSVRTKWYTMGHRYDNAGSDWHLRMPGDWPVTVQMTMKELRFLASYVPPTGSKEVE